MQINDLGARSGRLKVPEFFDSVGCDPYDAPPMTAGTHQHTLNPGRLARARATVEVSAAPGSFARLAEAVAGHEEAVTATLRFAPVRGGGVRVRGKAETRVAACCQTCLENIDLELVAEVDVLLHADAEVLDAQPLDQDTLHYADSDGEGELGLADLVEDQLLLELPMVPRHDDDCIAALEYEVPSAPELRRKSPFEALRDLDLSV